MSLTPEELERIDREHLWHPYTQMSEYPGPAGPLIVERGEGAEVIDIHGNRYLDGYAQMWCNVWGHGNKRLAAALLRQAEKISHSSLFSASNVPSLELTKRVLDISEREFDGPSDEKFQNVFFSDDGSTAVEVALKAAIQYQRNIGQGQRDKLLCFSDAYHGDTAATMTLGGVEIFRQAYKPLTFEVIRAPYPMQANPKGEALPEEVHAHGAAMANLLKLFKEEGERIAAVVIEPGCQGAGGVRPAFPGFLSSLRALCDAHGVLLIADEVLTAFGRCGSWFASATEEVQPDLIALGKALTAGYLPLSLTLATPRVYKAFLGERSQFKHLFHGHTFTGNQLGCAIALENLAMMEELDLMGHIAGLQPVLRGRLEQLEELPCVGATRHYGMMAGVPLIADGADSGYAGYAGTIGREVCAKVLERGVILRPLGDVIVVMPVLAMTGSEIHRLFDALEESIREMLS